MKYYIYFSEFDIEILFEILILEFKSYHIIKKSYILKIIEKNY